MKTTKFNINQLVRENIKRLKPYSSARDERFSSNLQMIFLDANENPYQNGLNRYPDPQQQILKSLIAGQKNVSLNNIFLGNGSDEILDLLFKAFCQPKIDNVIILPPTYGMYKVLSNINDIEAREVLLNKKFQPDVSKILEVIDTNTKIIFLCSPNNPTGNSFSDTAIARLLKNFNALVIIDEAYIDFSSQSSWTTKIRQYPNLMVIQTLSKAYAMAAIRLGIGYASADIIKILNKIKPPYNINELTQQTALEGLSGIDRVKKQVKNILSERKKIIRLLNDISFIEKTYKTDANFILVKVDNANKRYKELLKKGIVVRSRTTQPLCENTLRITIGTAAENKQLIGALKSISKNI